MELSPVRTVSLLVLAAMLGSSMARAAPSSDCGVPDGGSSADGLPSLPVQDRSHPGESEATNGYAALRGGTPASDCSPRLAPVGSPSSLRNDDADVMHGLPSSDVLAPVSQPRQAPMFR